VRFADKNRDRHKKTVKRDRSCVEYCIFRMYVRRSAKRLRRGGVNSSRAAWRAPMYDIRLDRGCVSLGRRSVDRVDAVVVRVVIVIEIEHHVVIGFAGV
jgi:hypothetical protein